MSVSSIVSQPPQHSRRKRVREEVDNQPHVARKAPKLKGSFSKVDSWLSDIISPVLKGEGESFNQPESEEDLSQSEGEKDFNQSESAEGFNQLESAEGFNQLESAEGFNQSESENMAKKRLLPEAPSSARSDDRSYVVPTDATGSTSSSKSKTADPNYWSVLRTNGIVIDTSGWEITPSIRQFLTSTVLKERKSAVLTDGELNLVKRKVSDISRQNENALPALLSTAMFPLHCDDIVDSVESLWHMGAMPRKEGYDRGLSQPKPDHFYGYKPTKMRLWTLEQAQVISHPAILPCSAPGRTNHFPFLVIEMKSEIGGHLTEAENQAAGGGSICVNALRWIFKEAGMSNAMDDVKDTAAFSITMNHRTVNFYVHWYSKQDDCFYMSWFDSIFPMKDEGIQDCSRIIANIFDWAATTRQKTIAKALDRLSPVPSAWNSGPINYNADSSDCAPPAPKKSRPASSTSRRSSAEARETGSLKEHAKEKNGSDEKESVGETTKQDVLSSAGSPETKPAATGHQTSTPSQKTFKGPEVTAPDQTMEAPPRKRFQLTPSKKFSSAKPVSHSASKLPDGFTPPRSPGAASSSSISTQRSTSSASRDPKEVANISAKEEGRLETPATKP